MNTNFFKRSAAASTAVLSVSAALLVGSAGQSGAVTMPMAKRCADGVYASGTASCPFARNVKAEYYYGVRYLYRVYSPTTGRYYTLQCSNSSYKAVCRVGRAKVTLYNIW